MELKVSYDEQYVLDGMKGDGRTKSISGWHFGGDKVSALLRVWAAVPSPFAMLVGSEVFPGIY